MSGTEVALFLLGFSLVVASWLAYGHFGRGGRRERQRQRLKRAVSPQRVPLESLEFAEEEAVADAPATIVRQARKGLGHGLEAGLRSLVPSMSLVKSNLAAAGLRYNLVEYGLVVAVVAFLLFLLLILFGLALPISALAGLVGGIVLPHFVLLRLGHTRRQKITRQLPEALDMIVRAVRAGLPVTQALQNLGEDLPAPLGAEFRLIEQQARLGMPLRDALAAAAERIMTQEFDLLVVALTIQQETGGNVLDTLDNLAETVRGRLHLHFRVMALSSEARASAWILGLLPIGVMLLLFVINRPYIQVLFEDSRGNVILAMASGMVVCGAYAMRRLIRFEY